MMVVHDGKTFALCDYSPQMLLALPQIKTDNSISNCKYHQPQLKQSKATQCHVYSDLYHGNT